MRVHASRIARPLLRPWKELESVTARYLLAPVPIAIYCAGRRDAPAEPHQIGTSDPSPKNGREEALTSTVVSCAFVFSAMTHLTRALEEHYLFTATVRRVTVRR
jgi:hypothetical protein